MANSLYLVAGIPGTRVKKSLVAFCEYVSSTKDRQISRFSVEEKLVSLAVPHVSRHFGYMAGSALGWLLLPRPFLRKLWRDAFEAVWQEVEKELEKNDVILHMHLCYFLHSTREFFFPADLDALKEKASNRVAAVITLIDDIYDCHRQLFDDSGAFDPPETCGDAILDLLTTLDWRSKETLLADSLAAAWDGKPHYVFAVKHPMETFFDLLYSDKETIYLSHPISEARQILREGNTRGARLIVREISELVARLRSRHVVIEPTAIDEARMKPDLEGRPSGNLEARWPFDQNTRQLLFQPPTTRQSEFAFPVGWEGDHRNDIPHSALLSKLQNAILCQINARDHSLVEQSKLIACYRPLFRGNASRGVKEELQHARRLIELDVRSPDDIGVVLCPDEDRSQYPYRELANLVGGWQEEGDLAGESCDFDRLKADILERSNPDLFSRVLAGDSRALGSMCAEYNIKIPPSKRGQGSQSGGALGTSPQAKREEHAGILAQDIVDLSETYLDSLEADGFIKRGNSQEWFFQELGC